MIKKLTVKVLVEDSVNKKRGDLIAKHGLSLLVEGEGNKEKFSMLMDTGPSPNILLHNIKVMGVDLSKIRFVFISHGHYDHTGGLLGIIKHIGKKAFAIAHPKVFDMKLKIDPILENIGSPFKQSEVEAVGGVILLAKNSVKLTNEIMTTGEIDRNTVYEEVKNFWTIDGEIFKEDIMQDDQALIINVKGKGLVIVSGCAHSGIINTVRQAKKVAGIDNIYAVLGGFHLNKADKKRIQLTTDELLKIDPKFVGPCHCTGVDAINQLVEVFGDRCDLLRTGDVIKL